MYIALGADATLDYAPAQNFDSEDWGGQKTIWAVRPSNVGLLLVRGRQLDGPNAVRFGIGNVPATEMLFSLPFQPQPGPFQALPDPPNNGWTYLIDYTRVRAPGCYAYQIDGETFSEVVVFRAERQVP